MKPIKSLEQFEMVINNRWDMFYLVNGTRFALDIITALNLKVIDLMQKIKEGSIFYLSDGM